MSYSFYYSRLKKSLGKYRQITYTLLGRGAQKVRPWPSINPKPSFKPSTIPLTDRIKAIDEAIAWLFRSQDACNDGGSSAWFSVKRQRWASSYPETTGYIIVTLFESLQTIQFSYELQQELQARALRMANWLLEIQLENGAYRGGQMDLADSSSPNLFNTGQIITGLLSAGLQQNNETFLAAAERAADWMCSIQELDGSWQQCIYDRNCRTYYTRAIWSLALASQISAFKNAEKYRDSAHRFAEWVLKHQKDNGWIDLCSFYTPTSREEYKVLHTIAYTIEGLLEIGNCLNEPRYCHSATQAAEILMKRFEIDGMLYGEYNEQWRSTVKYVCVTGCAQMGRIWGRCYELTNDIRFFNALLKMNNALRAVQPDEQSRREIRGGFPGSIPIYERYLPNTWPNWAVKFALDSFLIELRILEKVYSVETCFLN
jgi:hypothetical protein